MSRGHGSNRQVHIWVSEEDFQKLEQWLDKFSAGETFSDQMRAFIHWLVTQTEEIDQTKLVQKLQQTEERARMLQPKVHNARLTSEQFSNLI